VRLSERDIKMRDLYLQIDRSSEVNLRFGETVELQVDPGEHRLELTNRLYRTSVDFSIESDEHVEFEVANVKKPGLLNAIAFISGSVNYKPVIRRLQ
jgi:hypothetical protein